MFSKITVFWNLNFQLQPTSSELFEWRKTRYNSQQNDKTFSTYCATQNKAEDGCKIQEKEMAGERR
jgi:hypothetical protein